MERKYIKFKEWDKADLERVCRLAEKHWYKKWGSKKALSFELLWLLDCDEYWHYYTSVLDEEELKGLNYTELEEEEEEELYKWNIKDCFKNIFWVETKFEEIWEDIYLDNDTVLQDIIDIEIDDIIKHMRKWQKEYDNKFKNAQIFWEMFFKELRKQLEK